MTCEDAPCCGCCGTLAWSAETYSDIESDFTDFDYGPDEWDEE